ncbi:MAG: hypothetical protein Q9168_004059 [Polycauliona sp. 1 TL-2023]
MSLAALLEHPLNNVKTGEVSPVPSAASHAASSPASAKPIKDETSPSESNLPAMRVRKNGRSITANACTNCKKARSKALKEQLIREIQQLQAENRSLTQQNSFLSDRNDVMKGSLQSLKDDGQVGELVSRLVNAENHQAILDLVTQAPAMITAPPAAPQQLDRILLISPQQSDSDSGMLSWMDVCLQDPRCQMRDIPDEE